MERVENLRSYTLWLFNIAMENGPSNTKMNNGLNSRIQEHVAGNSDLQIS